MGPPLLVKRNISGRADEDTRPYGGHRSLPFFFAGAGHWPARGRDFAISEPPSSASHALGTFSLEGRRLSGG